jgi:hypothetical protein
MKHRTLLSVILLSICICAQSQTDPALQERWTVFKMALREKSDILHDFTSAIKKRASADSTLLQEIKVIGDYFDLRLKQRNMDAIEIQTILDLNQQLDERFSKAIEKIAKKDKLMEIEDFLQLQSDLGWAMNRIYVTAEAYNEIAKTLDRTDLHIELHKGTQPPEIKF